MIGARHPEVARRVVKGVATRSSRCLGSVADSTERLKTVGARIPSWEALAGGVRPGARRLKDREPNEPHHGWQKVASTRVNTHHREEVVWPLLSPSEQASVRSQSGPMASVPYTTFPVDRVMRFDSQSFRVLLLRRLRLPLPLSSRFCSCGRSLDVFGHHRAACGKVGVLSRRGYAVESAVAQICREGGARVSTNVMVRDLDIAQGNSDSHRLEVIAEGLSLFGGVQLALDATLVSAHHGDGTPLRKADTTNGVALRHARKRKEDRYPELCGTGGRARMVVIAGEVGGRWSGETQTFVQCLAQHKAKSAPKILQASAQVACYRRWSSLLSCLAAKAFATSLLERRGDPGAGGRVPSAHEVLGDARHA